MTYREDAQTINTSIYLQIKLPMLDALRGATSDYIRNRIFDEVYIGVRSVEIVVRVRAELRQEFK